ncbi:HTH domain-containing protein [Clavibacter michiganensis]|uniref:Uncharacterized protein n=1 Tax=Clavibacter michiganensis TaxID=28447 RepID=A0A251YNY9_9MICO|nr:HTH domain-containing protein [Clavibacter michiganensis]OUE25957.1 hypothetical protein BFL37_05630 [Clavibacter michiganensis]
MTVEAHDVRDELGRLIATGHISVTSLHAITGIPVDALESFLGAAPPGPPSVTATPAAVSGDDGGRLSGLTAQLVHGVQIDDDNRLQGILDSLTAQFHLTHENIALLTGVRVEDLEAFVRDPETVTDATKWRLGIRSSYIITAIGNAAPGSGA